MNDYFDEPEYPIPEPTPEQQAIIKTLHDPTTKGVIVDAVAGSGKTTTILNCILEDPSKRYLILTYNKAVNEETKKKIIDNHLHNTKSYTMHGYACHYYVEPHNRGRSPDTYIMETLYYNKSPHSPVPPADIIFIDEAQDLTPILFSWVKKIYRDMMTAYQPPKIIALGDRYQAVYKHMGADQRFLMMIDDLMGMPYPTLTISYSQRIPKGVADLLNNCYLRVPRIKSEKVGCPHYPKPEYYIVAIPQKGKTPPFFTEIINSICKYPAEDIMILAPTVSTEKIPVSKLTNLIPPSHPIVKLSNDKDKTDPDELIGKIIVASPCRIKGMERKVVVLFGMDDSYHHFIQKNDPDPTTLQESFYVSMTRAQERLIIIHNALYDYPKFAINAEAIKDYTIFREIDRIDPIAEELSSTARDVTKLLNHQLSETLERSYAAIKDSISHLGKLDTLPTIKAPSHIKVGDYTEFVADLTGRAIPHYYTITNINKLPQQKMPKTINELLTTIINTDAAETRYKYRKYQIPPSHRNWISLHDIKTATMRINTVINTYLNPKETLYAEKPFKETSVKGRTDFETETAILEVKCTESLTEEHVIQTAIYGYAKKKPAYLLNVLTGELMMVSVMPDNIMKRIIEDLITSKTECGFPFSDEEFLREHSIVDKQ